MSHLEPKAAHEVRKKHPDSILVDCRRETDCYGFEKELDEERHRNTRSGWRYDDLPWEQVLAAALRLER